MFILTTLEEMAAQLMQQIFAMAPNQAIIESFSILPDSEYENGKRTFSNGLRPDHEQVSWRHEQDTRTFNVSIENAE